MKARKIIICFAVATGLIVLATGCSANKENGHENEHEYVDLGLSVKWATCNVGAIAPEDFGNYYAWGEATTKRTYNWSTYKWRNGSYLTKYCTSSSRGRVDNKTRLDFADDAARANWGGQYQSLD